MGSNEGSNSAGIVRGYACSILYYFLRIHPLFTFFNSLCDVGAARNTLMPRVLSGLFYSLYVISCPVRETMDMG